MLCVYPFVLLTHSCLDTFRPKGMDIDAQPGSGRQSPAIIVTSQSDDISHEPPKVRSLLELLYLPAV